MSKTSTTPATASLFNGVLCTTAVIAWPDGTTKTAPCPDETTAREWIESIAARMNLRLQWLKNKE
jgi:hypothetical protein